MLAELGAVALSWGLEPAYDTLLYALAALLTVGTGADPLAPSSPRRRLAVVRPRSCECAHRGSAAGLGSPRRSRGVGRRPSGGVARAVELAADDAVVGGDPPAVPHRSPAQPPLVDGGVACCSGLQLKAVTSVEVKGRVGPGGVEGLLVTFERQVG